MVIATELCALSEYRIYPGNGKLFIRRDGKPVMLGSSKAYSLTVQRKKPSKLVWTQVWRRLNKKGLSEATLKKRTRKSTKVQRAVVGASLEEIRKKASQKSDFRTAQRDAALKEAKAKAKAAKAKAKKSSKGPAASTHVKTPKFTKRANRGMTQR
eukprot:CAMPEP_0116028230 /NCGR_PEP_ID=MMETSP0321-20121206/15251_1 /TAXON_ID=163516 /ORGANISM="Leptocylindrus danicus var. danicus, Strain B650" /LENGTH=154 /DNA_ID=CAMNT_0003502037 /DNA_START=152 /DNA_END=616 /DNA_ORIENTATION=+